ncbi:MAG: metallophosphoesterase [Candidatus Hydrogenedentota bacterium]
MLWRFVQVSDPHLGSEMDGQWNNGFICSMMPDVMRCLKGDLAKLEPDFILATGGICSHQTRDAMFAARDLMDSLGFPYYPMGGNHDFVLEDSRAWFLEAFHAHLPVQNTYYSFDHKNLHFSVLDAWWKWSDDSLSLVSEPKIAVTQKEHLKGARWELPQEQLDWLHEDLKKNVDKPCIVSSHYPAVGVPDRLRKNGLKDGGCLQNGKELIDLLHKHPQVRAIFAGHLHMHVIEKDDQLTHVATGALPEYPTEYRDMRVYEDRIEIETLGLSDPSFSARSLIPGNDFTAGQPQDRTATISLV